MSINNRVRDVRRALKLTQKEFGQKITVAQTYLSQIEKGTRDVTEKIQKLICLQFNVNEEWLSTGKGEMFLSFDKQTLLDELAKKYDLDEFSRNFIRTYINLPKHERDSIKNFANILAAGGDIKPEMSKEFGVEISDSEIEKEIESYRHELEVEKTAEEKSSASEESKEA